MTVLLRQLEQLDYLPGTALLSVPFDERFPDPVETRRPQAGLPSLFQRLRSGECAWLAIQNIEIVLQIQDLLLAAITTLVTGDAPAIVPKLYGARIRLRLHLRAGRHRDGISVCEHLRTAQAVYGWKTCLRKIDALFRERQKILTFNDQARPHNLLASGDE